MENSTLICGAGDGIFARREGRRHDIRRRVRKDYFSPHCSCFFLFVMLCWHPTNFFVCIAVLASNQFFCLYCCVWHPTSFLFVLLRWHPTSFLFVLLRWHPTSFLFVLLCWHPTSFLFVLLRWHPISFFVCIAALASNQFFCLYCCVGIQPLDSCLQWWHPPWYSEEEGAAVTIHLGVTCKQLSVLATLVIVFQKLFYHL